MKTLLPILLASAAFAAPAIAQHPATQDDAVGRQAAAASPPSEAKATRSDPFKSIWDSATLHKDKTFEFRLVGRFHLDNYVVDSNQGNASDLVVRRARFGARGRSGNFEAHVETELDLEGGPLYSRLTDAYVAWRFSDAARAAVGKQSVKFTLDGATSSNELLTIDRSNVANNFWFTDEYASGVSLSGKSGKWVYNAGLFSGGRKNREFGRFDAGYFWLASAGYDFGESLGVKRALLRADYVYNDPNPGSNLTRPFEHIGALAFILDSGRWGFSGDLVAGDGSLGQSDAFGATAMPWVNLTNRLQLVGRYTYVNSEKPNGVRFARYENAVATGRGDRYNEIYAGLNYLVFGHKLKLQTGLTYAEMRDRAADGGAYDGWTWASAFRLSF
jgi:phosphate-selective porin OprO and OprP